ncbi:MAG: hypothetical protein NT121_17295, partial [Chloroflexi bacterium]|nr:hypothetical protein [Chloroflexota bacterium]
IHRRSPFSFRNIRAFSRIRRAASLVVEDGTRLHVALGNGSVLTPAGASALAGLALLRRLGEVTSLSDRPPVATTGSGLLNLLAQDTLRAAHNTVAVDHAFDMNNARITGFTPLAYVAGVMPAIRDESISSNVLIGNFGPEVGLLTESADRQNANVIAASDNLTAQAVLYAASSEPLIGEELFAAGAYLQAGASHSASLLVQDILRWFIILALLAGPALKMAGVL